MGVAHLKGKRTGRPPGSKSASPWIRDANWVYKNLDNEDARPPSALAGRLLALGRENPDRFFACLAALDPPSYRADEQERSANGHGYEGESRRVKQLTVSEDSVFLSLRAEHRAWVHNPPSDAHIVGCEANASKRTVTFIVHSRTFPELDRGEPIAEFERARNPRF